MMHRLAGRLNSSFSSWPRSSVACLLGCEILSIYGSHTALVAAGVSVPPEFALAFALSRPFRRMRLPVELLGAGVLSRAVPALTEVKLTGLTAGLPESVRNVVRTAGPLPRPRPRRRPLWTASALRTLFAPGGPAWRSLAPCT